MTDDVTDLETLIAALQACTLDVSALLDWQPTKPEASPTGPEISAILARECA